MEITRKQYQEALAIVEAYEEEENKKLLGVVKQSKYKVESRIKIES